MPRFPPPGPRGPGSPVSSVLSRHSDFLPPVSPHFVAFVWRYHQSTRLISLPLPPSADGGPGVLLPVPLPVLLSWRRQDLPSSWGTPIPVCTCSATPAGRIVPDLSRDVRMAPVKGTPKAPTTRKLSRLNSTAFGLAAYVLPCRLPFTAQGSLPGAGQTLLDGLPPARFHQKVFNSHPVCCPPFPSFLAQAFFSSSRDRVCQYTDVSGGCRSSF
jgi:hypothetical protein